MDWLSNVNWGDVPSWIGVILAIAVPVIAYLERNRIAVFFKKKAKEPLPQLPPARFSVRPLASKDWALINGGLGDAYNVRLAVEDATAGILTSGFWELFLGGTYGTFRLQLSTGTIRFGRDHATSLLISWQDKNGDDHVERVAVFVVSTYSKHVLDWSPTEEGKILPVGTLPAEGESD